MSGTFEQARDFFIQGLAHCQAGRLQQAESSFAASLALVPGRPSTLTNLAAVRLKLGRAGEAAELLAEALQQEPDNAETLAHHARALALQGRHAQALESVRRSLAANPELASSWSLQGELLKELGRVPEAVQSFDKAIALGADPELHGYYLAAITGRDIPLNAPRQYVQALFEDYAQGFDEHLVSVLHYRAPQVLADGLQAMRRRFARALDLGCGTGLCGPLLRPLAGALTGVDLAVTMVDHAQASGAYDEVVHADVLDYLRAAPHAFDLVAAADVFIYIGALEAVFAGVARCMPPGGVFCFSVEAAPEGEDLVLCSSLRYAHSRGYIEQLARQHGFDVTRVASQPIREDQQVPIPGLYFWLVRCA